MTTWIIRAGRSRRVVFFAALTACAASMTTGQQSTSGTEQHSIAPLSPMAAEAHPSFEVATIKPADPGELKGGGHRRRASHLYRKPECGKPAVVCLRGSPKTDC
jgi:hypothetical protein